MQPARHQDSPQCHQKNHQNHMPPQHATATRVALRPLRAVSLYVTFKNAPPALQEALPRTSYSPPVNYPQQKKKARGHASAGLQKNPGKGEPASSGLLVSRAAARQSAAAPLTPPAPSPHSPQPSPAACPPWRRRAHTSRTTPRPSRSRRSSPCRSGSTRCSGSSPSPRTSAAAC